jgi:CheY-like chemotaxis protein
MQARAYQRSRTTATVPNILHVDDDRDEALLVRAAFERARVLVQLQNATDGQEAIDYLCGSGPYSDRRKFPIPDLILLDLNMPGMDGFDVLAWLRHQEQFQEIPVLIFSSSEDPADMRRARELGAAGHIVKTSQFDELVASVGTVVREKVLSEGAGFAGVNSILALAN